MNPREPRLLPREYVGVRRFVAVLLLPLLDPTSTHATGRMRSSSQFRIDVPETSAPYLLAVGSPPLRFQEFTPPPDLSIQRPATGVGSTPSAISTIEATVPDVIVAASSKPVTPSTPVETKIESKDTPLPPKKSGPAPILPDETRPQIRAEDFLPFFQVPGSQRGPAEVSVIVPVPPAAPAPASLTPSSATYTQTPR